MKSGYINARDGKIELSKIIIGTSSFGTTIKNTDEMFDTYYSAGGRSIDTARIYGDGISEQVVGEWIKRRDVRKDVQIITKGAHPLLGQMNISRLNREDILSDCHDSLKALQTDYIDVYFLHRDDKTLPVSGIMDALHELVSLGKAKAIGASNWTVKRILEANSYAAQNGKTPFCVSQILWSYAQCTSEAWGDTTLICMSDAEYAEYLKANIPVMAFSPQAKGMFSKYIENGENALNDKIIRRFLTDENKKRIEKVREICSETGMSPAATTLSYITDNPLNGFAIVGCSSTEQLKDSLSAMKRKDGIFDAFK